VIEGPVIQTSSGDYVSLLFPHEWTPRIDDIAHALSNLCRFTGHTRRFYSVGEHSCRVADLMPPELRLAGLLHDASEAYLGDMSRPLKHHPFFGEAYRDVERALQGRIDDLFGVTTDLPDVHAADLVLLATEKRDLMPPGPDWKLLEGIEPLEATILPWSPDFAKASFLLRYGQLVPFTVAA
jgi:uncharacterized protein